MVSSSHNKRCQASLMKMLMRHPHMLYMNLSLMLSHSTDILGEDNSLTSMTVTDLNHCKQTSQTAFVYINRCHRPKANPMVGIKGYSTVHIRKGEVNRELRGYVAYLQ